MKLSRTLAEVAVVALGAAGLTVGLSVPAQAAAAGECTVGADTPRRNAGSYAVYGSGRFSCNTAKSVRARARLYVYLPGTGWSLYQNVNADKSRSWSSLNGSASIPVTQTAKFCQYRLVADVSYVKGGVRIGRQAIREANLC